MIVILDPVPTSLGMDCIIILTAIPSALRFYEVTSVVILNPLAILPLEKSYRQTHKGGIFLNMA